MPGQPPRSVDLRAARFIPHGFSQSSPVAAFSPIHDASSDSDYSLNHISWQAPASVGQAVLENQPDRIPKVLFCFLNRLALAIGARDLRTNRPIATFGRLFDDCGEFRLSWRKACLHLIWRQPCGAFHSSVQWQT
jgi:hypothetical protein